MITADDWMGMYHMADDRADKAEAENERYKLMIKSITGGLDECMETVHFLEAENAKLRKVAEAARAMVNHCDSDTWFISGVRTTEEDLRAALAELDEDTNGR